MEEENWDLLAIGINPDQLSLVIISGYYKNTIRYKDD